MDNLIVLFHLYKTLAFAPNVKQDLGWAGPMVIVPREMLLNSTEKAKLRRMTLSGEWNVPESRA